MSKGSINTKKCASELSEYIWDSAFLRPIFFNPFILAILVICIIWMIDYAYFKRFTNDTNIIQHAATTYILVVIPLMINNMLIKYYYRQKKVGMAEQPVYEEQSIDSMPVANDINLVAYGEQPVGPS